MARGYRRNPDLTARAALRSLGARFGLDSGEMVMGSVGFYAAGCVLVRYDVVER